MYIAPPPPRPSGVHPGRAPDVESRPVCPRRRRPGISKAPIHSHGMARQGPAPGGAGGPAHFAGNHRSLLSGRDGGSSGRPIEPTGRGLWNRLDAGPRIKRPAKVSPMAGRMSPDRRGGLLGSRAPDRWYRAGPGAPPIPGSPGSAWLAGRRAAVPPKPMGPQWIRSIRPNRPRMLTPCRCGRWSSAAADRSRTDSQPLVDLRTRSGRCQEQPERGRAASTLQSAAHRGCDPPRIICTASGVTDKRGLPRSLGCRSPHASAAAGWVHGER